VYQIINAGAFAVKIRDSGLSVPNRETHIRPLHTRLDEDHFSDNDRIAVWRDVLATTNGARTR